MKKNIGAMILTGSILLSLTACSNYEPLVSRDGVATGSAVSGNSVTSVVSGGAVEGDSKDKQDNGNGENSGKEKTSLPWSQWYRNCNSNKMYYTSYQNEDKATHIVQVDLNGKEKKKVLKTKADEVLWVTDEWIYINVENKIYRIPIKRGEDRQESLDTSNKECIISDLYYDEDEYGVGLYGMDDSDIYYINKEKKIIAYHIANGAKRVLQVPNGRKDDMTLTYLNVCCVSDSRIYIALGGSLYCIHRDTLEVEHIISCGISILDGYDDFVYMEETDELYFTHTTGDFYGVCDTELCVYDGNTVGCVVSQKEINDFICKNWNITKEVEGYFESFDIYCCDEKVYIEYLVDEDDDDVEGRHGVLTYDRNGNIYEEEKLAEQVKKHSSKKDNYCYDLYEQEGDTMYLSLIKAGKYDESDKLGYSYNLKTGEMKKVSARTRRLLEIGEKYHKTKFK